VEVLGPKGPVNRFGGTDIGTWARHQLRVATDILDNPGGGLLFATQTIGQVRAGLEEEGGERHEKAVSLLAQAEEQAVRRHFGPTRELVGQALEELDRA
jgi:hypothetical protein